MAKEIIEFCGEARFDEPVEKGKFGVGSRIDVAHPADFGLASGFEVVAYWERPGDKPLAYVDKKGKHEIDLSLYREWEEMLPLFRERLEDAELLVFDFDGTLYEISTQLDTEFQKAMARESTKFLRATLRQYLS